MQNCLSILKVNLKHNLVYHILCCIILLSLSPLFIGTENLEQLQTIHVVEKYLSLIGIILLTTVFLPDTNNEIRELILSKKVSSIKIIGLRIIQAIFFILIIGFGFFVYLKIGNCEFNLPLLYFDFFANSIFLGSIALLLFSIFDQPVIAYMIPFMYFVANIFIDSKIFSSWYLFSKQEVAINEKIILIITGFIFILIAILCRVKKVNNLF